MSKSRITPKDDWVPVEIPGNFDEMLDAYDRYQGEKVGWCFLCNGPIRTDADLISGTNTHNCEAGRAFERKVAEESSQSS